MNTQVKEAAALTKHTQVIGRIQELLKSSNGRAVMRNMKREKDKFRVLNEQVALEQAKQGKAAAQIQAVAKISGIVEKYAYYKKGEKYGKSQKLQEVQKEKVEDMVKEATGKPIPLDENSHEHILKYVQTLAPQERDAFLRAIEQVVDGGSQAMHVDPAQFMPTVSAVHENEPGRKKLSVGKSPVLDVKKSAKKSKKKDRETIIPTYQDVTDSNLADTELYNNVGVV